MATVQFSDKPAVSLVPANAKFPLSDPDDLIGGNEKIKTSSFDVLRTSIQSANNIVPVFQVSDFPTPSDGSIQLADKTYVIFNDITLTDTLVFGDGTIITDYSLGNNTLTITASNMFDVTNASGGIGLDFLNIAGSGTNTLFSGTATIPTGLSIQNVRISNVLSLGSATDVSISTRVFVCNGFKTGLALVAVTNGSFINISYNGLNSDLNEDNVDVISISGEAWDSIDISSCGINTKANGNCFNIHSGVTANTNISFINYNGGELFKVGGLNQASNNVLAQNNINHRDSSTGGLIEIRDNTTETSIISADTWTETGLTFTVDGLNEKFSHSGDTLTYESLDPFVGTISATGVIATATPVEKKLDIGIFVNDVFVIDFPLGSLVSSNNPTAFSIAGVRSLIEKDTTIKLKVKNITDTINIVLIDANLVVNK